jgi:exodeoxyribonuclease VII large subunit
MRYTVTELNRAVHTLLERQFQGIEVVGEVAQIQIPSSGHAYLTLRHQTDTISAVMWRTNWVSQRFRPKVGDLVVCRGTLGVYGARGSSQLYVTLILPVGTGLLAAELEARKARLAADGLLDPRRKRALPPFPRFVGVATSLAGAALQDFLKVSRERLPSARILVAGCVVQGPEAPAAIQAALELLWVDGRAEVIVVTRGGGSKEDLLAFQDEGLARCIAQSPVPVVSAVGHQIDTTIADLVADAVAPTPTAAAVLVLPDQHRWTQRIDDAELNLSAALGRWLTNRRRLVAHARDRLRHPGERLARVRADADAALARISRRLHADLSARRQTVDALSRRSTQALPQRVTLRRQRVDSAGVRLAPALLSRALQARARLERATTRLDEAMRRAVASRHRQLEMLDLRVARLDLTQPAAARLATAEGTLRALSPYAVLERGYAIVTRDGASVLDAALAPADSTIGVRLARGRLQARVLSTEST